MKYQKTGRGDYTHIKQSHIRDFLNLHITLSKQIINKHKWFDKNYMYIDICAGDGGDEIVGSPIIASSLIEQHGIKAKKIFIEENPKNFKRMSLSVEKYGGICLNEDHSIFFSNSVFRKGQIGLLYYDPNGDPFVRNPSMIVDFYKKKNTRQIDFLMYASFTNIKRVRCCNKTKRTWGFIDDKDRIDKKHWLIREPVGKQQWTLLFGTNWTDFPKMKRIGLHDVNSNEGKRILMVGNYTKHEIEEQSIELPKIQTQLDLFPMFINNFDTEVLA